MSKMLENSPTSICNSKKNFPGVCPDPRERGGEGRGREGKKKEGDGEEGVEGRVASWLVGVIDAPGTGARAPLDFQKFQFSSPKSDCQLSKCSLPAE